MKRWGCFFACIFHRSAVSHAHFNRGAEGLVREGFCRQRALFSADRLGARHHLCGFCRTAVDSFAAERFPFAASCRGSGLADIADSPDGRASLRRLHGHDGRTLFGTLARAHVGNHEGQPRGSERRLCLRPADDFQLVGSA